MKGRAVWLTGPRRVEVREIEVPDPSEGEVQVRCVANGICMYEVSLFTGVEPATYPRGLGHEGIGVAIKVGRGVQNIQEGDWVACFSWATVANCPASSLARFSRPPSDPACFLAEPVACVVIALYEYDLTPGDRVLVLGTGFMGLLNVQGLAHCPLAELIAADVKPFNLELARVMGATELIRVDTDEGRARLDALADRPLDLVVEAAGVPETIRAAGRLVRSGGRLGLFAWHHGERSVDLGVWHHRGIKVLNASPPIGTDRAVGPMQRAVALLERGVFDLRRLVTHRHSIDDAQTGMEIAAERPEGYVKGVLTFGE